MRARELFDLSRPLADQAYDLSEVPEWREMVEQAERYKKAQPEFRFPELLKVDEAAHHSFHGNGVCAPLPENWERYGRTFTQWELRGYDVQQLRPGVSPEFLRSQNIRHVDIEEAECLLGFRPTSGGLWIPYSNPHNPGGPLIANGRPFGRLRLDKPSKAAKYLSPEKSGAQLYVPAHGPPLPFGKELVVVEGEFKAGALHEAGIKAVGIGGFSSAMSQGQLIPGLAKVLSKWPPEILYFLGDADTALNFEFSREATKLARALPQGTTLKLPRIPIGLANGIDDCRAALGDGFLAFWQQITQESTTVEPKLPAGPLAVKLAARELGAIAALENNEIQVAKLCETASYLDPLSLESLAGAVQETLGLKPTAFRDTAKQIADERKAAAAKRQQEQQAAADVAQILNDPRPKIEIPASRSRLSSEFAHELGRIIARQSFFSKDGIVVCPDAEKACLTAVTALAFRTKIEDYIIPFKVSRTAYGERTEFRTISRKEADTVLSSDQFIKQLRVIRAVNNVRLPVVRATGGLELLPEGYDAESSSTLSKGSSPVGAPRSHLPKMLNPYEA